MPILQPSQTARSIYEIDGEALQQAGIRGIILDWSNTVTDSNTDVMLNTLKAWAQEFQSRYAIKLVIVSNSKPPRRSHEVFDEIPALFEAGKPKKKAFFAAMNILGTQTKETAVIGNGIMTDIWAGNRLGMHTIFVSSPRAKPQIVEAMKRAVVRLLRV
ncbi:YqeG family HAD IIIA-type phosphatase [Aneurinibacillus sp. REN35]|uniref:YqeG family HAD IIIA-type phosphatase n=1 Tax=Aneurinibacillus sp. REN35 TaxID=3237286 RepID=UPI00352929C9